MPSSSVIEHSSVPAVSIVTVCKNAAGTIERALRSVAACSHPSLQYVVVDGGSTDGTREILELHRAHIHKMVSEPDRGISDALNKAIELSDGEYHLLLHADDVLLPGAVERLHGLAVRTGAEVACGAVLVMNGDTVVRKFTPVPRLLHEKMSIPHMGALVRKQAWRAVGGYDLRRRLAMDHLLMLQILKRYGLRAFATTEEVVAHYSLGGVSDRHVLRGFGEIRENLLEEGSSWFAANAAYWKLVCKSRLGRLIRGS
jgi:glycosyltransferase involved in cell wall biosynthesis